METMVVFATEDGAGGFFWTALIAALGTAGTTALLNIERLYKVINDVRLTWFKETTSRDDNVIKRLETHLDKCDKELDAVKSDHTRLITENNDILLDMENLYAWMEMIFYISKRNASALKDLGGHPEDLPEIPKRKVRRKPDQNDFRQRTEKTGDSLMGVAVDAIKKKVSEEGGPTSGGT